MVIAHSNRTRNDSFDNSHFRHKCKRTEISDENAYDRPWSRAPAAERSPQQLTSQSSLCRRGWCCCCFLRSRALRFQVSMWITAWTVRKWHGLWLSAKDARWNTRFSACWDSPVVHRAPRQAVRRRSSFSTCTSPCLTRPGATWTSAVAILTPSRKVTSSWASLAAVSSLLAHCWSLNWNFLFRL